MSPPRAPRALVGVSGPSSQFCIKMPVTRSPGLHAETPAPTAATSPAASEQGMRGSLIFGLYSPFTTIKSRRFKETARTATNTSPGPGVGVGRSTNSNESMPKAETCQARMGNLILSWFPSIILRDAIGQLPRRMKIWLVDGKVNRWRSRWQVSWRSPWLIPATGWSLRKIGVPPNFNAPHANVSSRRSTCNAKASCRRGRRIQAAALPSNPLWRTSRRRFRLSDKVARSLRLAVDEQRIGLIDRGQRHASDIHMLRPRHGPKNYIGNVVAVQRRNAFVDLGGLPLVAVETHHTEFRLHEDRVDTGDAHRRTQQILAQPVVEGPRRGLGGAIH